MFFKVSHDFDSCVFDDEGLGVEGADEAAESRHFIFVQDDIQHVNGIAGVDAGPLPGGGAAVQTACDGLFQPGRVFFVMMCSSTLMPWE